MMMSSFVRFCVLYTTTNYIAYSTEKKRKSYKRQKISKKNCCIVCDPGNMFCSLHCFKIIRHIVKNTKKLYRNEFALDA
jgi:hypothetical protein